MKIRERRALANEAADIAVYKLSYDRIDWLSTWLRAAKPWQRA